MNSLAIYGFSKEKKCIAVLWIFSLFIHLAVLNHFIGWLCTDTAGYWLHAATFTGHDWSEAAKTTSMYYSWGYSLWLVIPFLIAPGDMVMMSRMAIVINAIFCSLTFVCSYFLGKKIFQGVSRRLIMVCAFIISLYPTYILETSVALSESLLFFLFIFGLWLLAEYLDTGRMQWAVLSSVCCGYMYIVHHRTLGIVIAFLCMLVILYVKNRSWQETLYFFIPLCLCIAAGICVDHWLMAKEMGEQIYTVNTYGAMAKKVPALLQLGKVLSMVQNMIGECWYILIGTFLIAGLGIISAGKKICQIWFGRKSWNKIENEIVLYAFGMMSLIFSIGISVFVTAKTIGAGGSRIDSVFYGRYFENVLAFFLFIGLIELSRLRKNQEVLKEVILLWIVTVAASVFVYYFTQMINGNGINYFSVTAVLALYSYPNLEFSVISASLYGASLAAVVMCLLCRNKKAWQAAAYFLVAGSFLYTGYSAVINVDNFYRNNTLAMDYPTQNEDAVSINGYLKEKDISSFGVYQEGVYAVFSYQLMNPQKKVYAIASMEDIRQLQGKITHIIIPQYMKEMLIDAELELETANYVVCRLPTAENMRL